VLVLPGLWDGATATSHPSAFYRWVAGLSGVLATLGVGWILARQHRWSQGWILALVGGIAWGAAGAFSALSDPRAGDIPWGAVVVANVVVGLFAVSVVLALGAGAKLAFDRLTPSRSQ
jgi:hypothetical protein